MAKTRYLWDPDTDAVLEEYDGTGATTAVYDVEPVPFGRVISQRRGGQTRWHQHDGLGSTVALSDETGAPTDTYAYDAWGNQIASTGTTPNPYRFCGEHGYQTDPETGAISVRRRTYRPTIARWTSPDPMAIESAIAIYSYVDGSPVLWIDPSGLIRIEAKDAAMSNVPCGQRTHLSWDFVLEKKAPCDGFFVQRVVHKCTSLGCERGAEEVVSEIVYYEAFAVRRNDTTATKAPVREMGPPVTDTAMFELVANTCAKREQTGEVKFYCDAGLVARNAGLPVVHTGAWVVRGPIGQGPCSVTAGNLRRFVVSHSRKVKGKETIPRSNDGGGEQPFWMLPSIGEPATRRFAAEWKCCFGCEARKECEFEAEGAPT